MEDEFDRYYKNRPIPHAAKESGDGSDLEPLKKTTKVSNFYLFDTIFADTPLEQQKEHFR